MYYITNENDLIGKTIAFTNFAQFAEKLTIVTEDGGIMVINVELDDDDYRGSRKRTYIEIEPLAKMYLTNENQSWIMKELKKKEILSEEDFQKYEEEKRKKLEDERARFRIEEEKRERELYERLKVKYENKYNNRE